ncbi:aminopeptidase P family N-terminal domain-containing protein [Candidatus Gottesmanbacteria bacterium]|nr:aminopeptidase P family N-terminal domain-containing protein [Candidatus Gottesmanbacteria bacterium]
MNHKINILREGFKRKKLEALLLTNFYNIRYLTGFVGLTPQEREAYLLVTLDQVFLLTDGRYFEAVKELSIKYKELRILEIKPGEKITKLLSGFNDLRVGEYEELKKDVIKDARACQITSTENLVEDLRAVKEPEEIEK